MVDLTTFLQSQVTGIDNFLGYNPTVTSGLRSPAHNADVGGVSNSLHLSGLALDLVPPTGVSMSQLASSLQSFPHTELLNEGNHVHIGFSGDATATGVNANNGGISGINWGQAYNDETNGVASGVSNVVSGVANTVTGGLTGTFTRLLGESEAIFTRYSFAIVGLLLIGGAIFFLLDGPKVVIKAAKTAGAAAIAA